MSGHVDIASLECKSRELQDTTRKTYEDIQTLVTGYRHMSSVLQKEDLEKWSEAVARLQIRVKVLLEKNHLFERQLTQLRSALPAPA
jgi:hypothetical protein